MDRKIVESSANSDNIIELENNRIQCKDSKRRRILSVEESFSNEKSIKKFSVGDHIYYWCSIAGVQKAYSHHGIVSDVDHANKQISIVHFYAIDGVQGCVGSFSAPDNIHFRVGKRKRENNTINATNNELLGSSLRQLNKEKKGILMKETEDWELALAKWEKVEYGVVRDNRHSDRKAAGTTSPVPSDPLHVVLARIEFLINHDHLLPSYHCIECNCECVVVWCKLGYFCSLQSSSLLRNTARNSAGFLGSFLLSWSFLITMPWFLPALAVGYSVSAGMLSYKEKQKAEKTWNRISRMLNDKYESCSKTSSSLLLTQG